VLSKLVLSCSAVTPGVQISHARRTSHEPRSGCAIKFTFSGGSSLHASFYTIRQLRHKVYQRYYCLTVKRYLDPYIPTGD
jgi:hypothetical protein